ncbi:hypothetical protein [Alteromonas sp. RKMC-009]|uniref:hypothetical protein n=1 Tax=Alteromonas sp. RKMC-009 TaxID=2267264 RepID=UPI0010C59CA7|nr:hypothetical protein [Alteromonas sp. RKMC-009]QBX05407.1 hypothetical protein DS731_22165 [Alteromonas sp. RKMC-009]
MLKNTYRFDTNLVYYETSQEERTLHSPEYKRLSKGLQPLKKHGLIAKLSKLEVSRRKLPANRIHFMFNPYLIMAANDDAKDLWDELTKK